MFRKTLLLFFALVSQFHAGARHLKPIDNSEQKIRLNQIGFYPDAQKIAIIVSSKSEVFSIQTLSGKTVLTGKLLLSLRPGLNGLYTRIADFSELKKEGRYRISVAGLGSSFPFLIARSVHHKVAAASIKAYYYTRASIKIEAKYAGKWNRAEGHPDDHVLVHPSASDGSRPTGTVISSPRGWYDAGDYNKYIVNSGISTYTLLSLYEDFPDHMKTVKLNIPESANHVPDVLNEALWNIRWMLTMQDPNDGGVYHKLTNAAFDKMVMPNQATTIRYVVQKSTAATLDFAAVMAQSARIFNKFQKEFPGLADSCILAAKKAWAWAQQNPGVLYQQNAINQKFDPKITTGEYGDGNVSDEFLWASAELFVTTGESQYLKIVDRSAEKAIVLPAWNEVGTLGYYSILRYRNQLNTSYPDLTVLKKKFLDFADGLINNTDSTAFKTLIQKRPSNFIWGSNAVSANQGMALIVAYKISGDKKYLRYALANLDYLLGRNGTGYSYLTGYGSKTPMHPHHRPSIADGIIEPIPGLLVGGPNPGMQDHILVPSLIPDEAYIDDDRAYAVNEIAINWNAPFAYLVNGIEALQNDLNN